MTCRVCGGERFFPLIDLGAMPPANNYLNALDLSKGETSLPLKVKVCESCFLTQTEDYEAAEEIFREDYAYFSSVSSSWVAHAKTYSQDVISRFGLGSGSFVIEIACNDGYLLKNFVEAEIPCLGIEPTRGTASAASQLNIPVLVEFFGRNLAKELANRGKKSDLIIGNNVYAHVPDINDFTAGIKTLLKDEGVVTLEFPSLLNLLKYNQFDTIYHEHFSYLCLSTVIEIFMNHGLRVFDVDLLTTHGGSLRVYGCHFEACHEKAPSVGKVLAEEEEFGLKSKSAYENLQSLAKTCKINLLSFLIEQKVMGKKVVGYGAAAKGNTFLNYAGVDKDLLPAIIDSSPSKQNKFMPGSRIPIMPPEVLADLRPDYVLILPWNIADEIIEQVSKIDKNFKFVTAIPSMKIY